MNNLAESIQINVTTLLNDKLLAFYPVGDKFWISYFLDIIKECKVTDNTYLLIPKGMEQDFKSIANDYSVEISTTPLDCDYIININHVFTPSKLERQVRKRKDPKLSYIFEVKTEKDLETAEAFFFRDDNLISSRYLNMPLAKKLALALRKTSVSPNHITFMTFLTGIAATCSAYMGSYFTDVIAAVLLQVALTLDLTDGYLARLTNKSSDFGHWFDTYIDSFLNIAIIVGVVAGAGINNSPLLALFGLIWIISFHSTSCHFWFREVFSLREGVTVSSEENSVANDGKTDGLLIKLKNVVKIIINACSGLDSKFHVISLLLILNMKTSLIYFMGSINLLVFFLVFMAEYKSKKQAENAFM